MSQSIGIVPRRDGNAELRHTEISRAADGRVVMKTLNELGVVVNNYDTDEARKIAALLIKAAEKI